MGDKDLKKTDKDKIIGVKFNTTSPKYKTKEYYYKTDKKVHKGQEITVEVDRNKKVDVIVTNTNYKGKIKPNLKTY